MKRPTHWEGGKLVTAWFDALVTVHGGWVVRRCRWHRGAEGWDQEEQRLAEPEILFITRDEAQAASGALLGYG